MKIGFIGAGKVGFSLGKYFSINNYNVIGYFSKNINSAKLASEFTNSSVFFNLNELIKCADLIFITTPDDKINEIWTKINKNDISGKMICHCSGSLSSKIFTNIENFKAFSYSIHPMYPFSDKYNSYKNMNTCFFSIEGSAKHLISIKSFIESLGNNVVLIKEENKILYHLANVTVSNLILSLIDIGVTYLSECGIDKKNALNALNSLILSNINNILDNGIENSLTGPVSRGDINTIKHHLKIIPNEHVEPYKILSQNLIKISEKKSTNNNYNQLKEYLGGLE